MFPRLRNARRYCDHDLLIFWSPAITALICPDLINPPLYHQPPSTADMLCSSPQLLVNTANIRLFRISYCIIINNVKTSTFHICCYPDMFWAGTRVTMGQWVRDWILPDPAINRQRPGAGLKVSWVFLKIEIIIYLIFWDFQCQCVDEQKLQKKSEVWRGTYFAGGPV